MIVLSLQPLRSLRPHACGYPLAWGGAIALAAVLSGCAGSSLGDGLQRALEPDSQLQESPPFGIDPASTPSVASTPSTPTTAPATSPATSEVNESAPSPASTSSSTGEKARSNGDDAASGAPRRQTAPPGDRIARTAAVPQPGDPDFIGPVRPGEASSRNAEADFSADDADLAAIPADLRSYVADLLALEVINPPQSQAENAAEDAADENASRWNQPVNRRVYARWLFTTHNRFYDDVAAQRLRPGRRGDQPAFRDVPPSDPDFAAIQGLAEAGIIPSALTGNSTAVNFRPDAPLTRETLVLWKVPLDTRAPLPTTNPTAVAESWGFQDANKVEPLALRAIAADFQLGDFANIRRAFGYTTLLQPQKAVTAAEAAATLWRFGPPTEGITAAEVRDRP